jgi:hypothetical protein
MAEEDMEKQAQAGSAGKDSDSDSDSDLSEQKTMLPPPADPGQPKQPPICDALTRRILMVSELFSNEDLGIRKCAANLLVAFAKGSECTVMHAIRILEILKLQNKKEENDFSPQVRKAKKAFKCKLDAYHDSPEFTERSTWADFKERSMQNGIRVGIQQPPAEKAPRAKAKK